MDPTFVRGGTDGAEFFPPKADQRPPHLAALDATPRYDLSTVVQWLGVNRMVLLRWEQQLGMPVTGRLTDDSERTRRYSERDFLALAWIRDRLMEGMLLSEAVSRLIAAQGTLPPHGMGGSAPLREPGSAPLQPPYRPPIDTRPLAESRFGPPAQADPPPPVPGSGYLGSSARQPMPPGTGHLGSSARQAQPPGTGHLGSSARQPMPRPIRPDAYAGGLSGPLPFGERTEQPEGIRARRMTGAAGADLRASAKPLLHAFGALDTPAANAILKEAMAGTSVEAVCVALLQPVLNRIDELWAHRQMTMPEQRFALNYMRGFLFAEFHAAVERPGAPLVFVGCGPREDNDVAALMLSVFWRRAGLRVIYLGQDVNGPELVEQARMRKPALVALVVCEPQRVRALSRIGRELHQVPSRYPIFGYCGPTFARNPELQHKVNGVYLGDDAMAATWHVRRLLGLNRPAADA